MAKCQCVAFHGWGFDRHIWQPWSVYLSEFGSFQKYDRGYFNNPKAVQIEKDSPLVLITHSYGLHWLDESMLEQADLLIVTCGFLYFHPYAAQYKRRSRQIVQEMINQLEVYPQRVLRKFYENSFAPQESPKIDFSDIDHQLLIDDLKQLQEAEIEVQKLKKVAKVCILHGSNDHVVTNKKGRQIYNQLQEHSQYFEIKNAGHALPKTHYRQCLEFITPEIERLVMPTI